MKAETIAFNGVRITGGRASQGAGISATGFVSLNIFNSEITKNGCKQSDVVDTQSGVLYTQGMQTKLENPTRIVTFGPDVSISQTLFHNNATHSNDTQTVSIGNTTAIPTPHSMVRLTA